MPIPKLKDIATATGLHEMTVSRALRNTGRMRPETRQRALDAARDLGYRPNAAASAMRTGHTGCIAMLSNPRYSATCLHPHVLTAIAETVSLHGGYLAHAVLPPGLDLSDALTLPRVLRNQMAEGLLLSDDAHDHEPFEKFLRDHALPAIWLNYKRSRNAIYPDHAGACGKVTERLLALGHRRMAFVSLDSGLSRVERDAVADAIVGHEAVMQQAGLHPDVHTFPVTSQADDPLARRLQPLADMLKDAGRRPTCIITREGPVMLNLLLQLGLRVPGDLSMVSFTACPSHALEQLVSWVPIPLEEMGRKGVEMLYRAIDDNWRDMPAVSLPYGEIASLHTVTRLG